MNWKRIQKHRRRWGVLAAVAAVALLLGWILCAGAKVLIARAGDANADYVVVLGGGANNRPFGAAALVRVGLADRVLVTRGAPSPETDEGLVPPEHELSRAVLLHRGVPAEQIEFLGAETHSTRDEALAVAAFLDDAPAARLTVVTDGWRKASLSPVALLGTDPFRGLPGSVTGTRALESLRQGARCRHSFPHRCRVICGS